MKKKIIIITTAIMSVCISAIVAFCVFTGVGSQFIIQNKELKSCIVDLTTVFSAEDSEEVFVHKLNEMGAFFYAHTFNTALIIYDESNWEYLNGKQEQALSYSDTLKRVIKWFKNREIQTIILLECASLTDDEILDNISEINKTYYPAGVMLEDYRGSYENLYKTSGYIKSKFNNYYFGIICDYNYAKPLAANNVMNLFVIKDDIADYSGNYVQWKNEEFANTTVLLNFENASFEKDLFILYNFHNPDGYILTEYTSPAEDLNWYYNILDTTEKLPQFNLQVNNAFALTNPSKDMSTYAEGIYVTGSGDTNQPLFVNGIQAELATDGTFGQYILLEEGDNRIEIVQGQNSILRTVTRQKYSDNEPKIKWDDTQRAYKGQAVQTINALTSLLSDPDYDSSIIDGIQQNVQMIVEKSVKTMRDGCYTWAYQLSNGGYVLAKDVEWISRKEYTAAKINTIYIENADSENEYLVFETTGRPAVVSGYKDGQIVFTFIDTALDKQYVETEGQFFVTDIQGSFTTECYVKKDGKNTVFVLENNTDNELWGYNVGYVDGAVKIYLKKTPKKIAGSKPLTGVSILLDAGHGGKDSGALGVGGVDGPYEKDINLAVSLATKECLERFGATVYMTREDDTYLTLEERRSIINEIKPDLFIAQHHNSLEYTTDASQLSGFESYYFTPQSANMAEIMANEIADSTGRNNLGYNFGYYYVLRNDIAPSVLNEYGFVNNPYEYSKLYTDEDIYKSAIGTALAVLDIIPEY